MRIAEVVDRLAIGGAERVVADLSLELKRRGHELHVLCLQGGGPLEKTLEQANIPVLLLRKGDGFRWRVARQMGRYFKENRIQIVHSHNPLVHHYAVLGARLAGADMVANTVHGLANFALRGRERLLFQLSGLLTDCWIGVCPEARTAVEEQHWLRPPRLAIVPNGIPLAPFASVERTEGSGEFIFGTVARLSPVKDQATMLAAFARLVAQGHRAQLHLLGEGPERNRLEALAEELGIGCHTVFAGVSLDVPAFLSRLDTFVLSSLSEGLPLALLEAMAAGLPVVSTAVGGIPETVRAADCGWLCEPDNADELAQRLLQAIDCRNRRGVGERGRRYVLQRHGVEQMGEAYEALFDHLRATRRQACQGEAPGLAS